MDGKKVLDLLQPMREALHEIEGAAMDGVRLNSHDLFDLSEKLIETEMGIRQEYHRELTEESDRLKAIGQVSGQ